MRSPKNNIQNSVLWVALIPITIMTFIFMFYFGLYKAQNIKDNLVAQVHNNANYLSKASEYTALTGNKAGLKNQFELINTTPEINSITLYDTQSNIIIKSKMEIKAHTSFIHDIVYKLFKKDSSTLIKKNIIYESLDISDLAENKETVSQNIGSISLMMNNKYIFYQQYLETTKGIYVTLAIYFASLYIILRFRRKIIDGIENIDKTLVDIESGNLFARPDARLVEQFGRIGPAIGTMANSIKITDRRLREEIDLATSKLNNYNKKIIKTNQVLLKAQQNADIANTAKTNFLANISHEIRTPVNGILGFTELLSSSSTSLENKSYVANIDTASNKLLSLINELLDFSKLESGHSSNQLKYINIHELLTSLHAFYFVTLKNKSVEMYINICPDTPEYIYTDEQKIEKIISNLISNAIKFTPKGFIKLKVTTKKLPDSHCSIDISVIDTGIGIAKKNHAEIFKTFEQADMRTNRLYGGSGLGLSISSVLAKNLDANISVKSTPEQGSTFSLKLTTQFLDKKFNKQFNGIKPIDYYDEDVIHRKNFSLLLQRMGATVSSISKLNKQSNNTLLCCFNTKKQALQFLQNNDSQVYLYENKIAFFSFYNKDIYEEFREKGFCYAALRSYKPKSIYNIFNQNKEAKAISIASATNDITALVVDDNNINISLMEKYLQKLGVNTFSSSDGQKALEILENLQPDIILTDLHMPKLSGDDLANKIRTHYSQFKNTPIIAVTADSAVKNHENAINNGINEVILKPISITTLKEKLLEYTNINFSENEHVIEDDIFTELDEMFVADSSNLIARLEKAITNDSISELLEQLHRMNGGLEYCHSFGSLLSLGKNLHQEASYEQIISENVLKLTKRLIQQLRGLDKH